MKQHFLTRPEAASYLGVSVSTLARWAGLREKVRYHRVGKRALYDQSDLDTFIANSWVDLSNSPSGGDDWGRAVFGPPICPNPPQTEKMK